MHTAMSSAWEYGHFLVGFAGKDLLGLIDLIYA